MTFLTANTPRIIYALCFLLLTAFTMLHGQTCTFSDSFTSQADIDNFKINNPTVTSFSGTVSIRGNDITNLDGLSNITTVGGCLFIFECPALTDISGLSTLSSVRDFLLVTDCNNLLNLNGLSSLNRIKGSLWIKRNAKLTDIRGLSTLSNIEGNLSIESNNALVNLSGLESLVSIGGRVDINDNIALQDLTGLNNLTSIGDYLGIYRNEKLTSIAALGNLSSVGTSIFLQQNPMLTDITGLEKIERIPTSFFSFENETLGSFQGLKNLKSIGQTFSVVGNLELTNFEGLNKLESAGGIYIERNTGLNSLDGLENLKTITDNAFGFGRFLTLDSNIVLTNIEALAKIASTLDTLRIFDNTALSSCAIQSVCTHLGNSRHAIITNNKNGCNNSAEINQECGNAVCVTDTTLTANPIANAIISAKNSINTSGSVTISMGRAVTFKAGTSIQLMAGFSVQQGGTFHAVIEECSSPENLTFNQVHRYPRPLYSMTEMPISSGAFEDSIAPEYATNFASTGEIIIAPNPTTGHINILGVDRQSPIRIVNDLGQTILERSMDDNTLNISTLHKGVYFLLIEQNGAIIPKRVIKF